MKNPDFDWLIGLDWIGLIDPNNDDLSGLALSELCSVVALGISTALASAHRQHARASAAMIIDRDRGPGVVACEIEKRR